MTLLTRTLFTAAMLLAAGGTHALADEAAAKRFYLIGNSLTWDTVPSRLDGDVQWHVDCGKSLPYITAHPEQPCVKQSVIWPQALRNKQYDVISVQPHYGSTLAEDVEAISAWMKMQPDAVFVIHTGWARHAQRADEFSSDATPEAMEHSPGYIRTLLAELRKRHPQRELRQTFCQNLLEQISTDIAAGRAPLSDLESLHRDAIHMTHDHGRYLMHNAMRRALGQPHSAAGFSKLDPQMKEYLDGVLAMLETTPADRALIGRVLSSEDSSERAALAAKLSDPDLRKRMTELLPGIEQARSTSPAALAVAAEVERIGGRVVWTPGGPQWLYLTTGDSGTELFDVLTAVDLYNGNNPLKGRGGRNAQVNNDWLPHLTGLTSLRRLDLANCDITGAGLRHLSGLTGLQNLNLTLTPVADDGLQHLSGMTELRSLGLASTQCTGTGFEHLTALKKLESVNFHFTPLNDAGLAAICRIPISDRLWFAHTHFTDAGAEHLARLKKLQRCGIGSKEDASSGEAVAALSQLPLVDLSLLDRQATPLGIAHAAKIATLRKFDVAYAPTVGDESMPLIAGMPKLQEFRLGSAQVTDGGLQKLAAAKSLKKLTLTRLKNVTPEGIEQLRKARPTLTIDVH